ncbi:hypothetical protein [Pseudonocardia sp. ICBG1293]|nr:hypothetical protein [Pseudonocardia sp. ICBG1293]
MSKAAIGRKLGLHPATVRKFAAATSAHELTAKRSFQNDLSSFH